MKVNKSTDFSDLSLNDFLNLKFEAYENNPVIRPFNLIMVADPSLLTPDNCHDKMWHMFLHTLFGVYHLRSEDGIHFQKPIKIVSDAMRPNINYIDGRYYLFFEKTGSLLAKGLNIINLAKWKSEIYVTESSDLIRWTKPKPVIRYTKSFESAGRGGFSLSNPYFIEADGKNRLYYSCGLTYIDDCGFSEPTFINYAESKSAASGYSVSNRPIISPDKNSEYLNLCSGCLKVYRMTDGYLGIQNGIYEKDGKSHSAIMCLSSEDGLHFRFEKVLVEPGMYKGADWMKQYVYASHLVRYNGELRLYFNGRDISDMVKGRECIGFIRAKL